VKTPRNPKATAWEQRRGTLEDQAIFGPLVDFECACGKYRGRKYQNMICDHCGVKLTTRTARRQRFGHIDLPVPVAHPLGQRGELLYAMPVLPAAFVESPGGECLAALYDELVRSVLFPPFEELIGCLNRLLESLLPVVLVAHEWNLGETEVLACGLAVVSHVGPAQDTCGCCGYPLEGLYVLVCPGCGTKLR
jgi:hypothetical protein